MAADDNWKELPEEQAWRECEAMLRRLLSSYLGGTAREHDAGEDGIAKAGMIFVAHHRAGYLLPFAYYVRVARNEAASAMRRRRWEEPVDFDEPSSRRHLRHRLEAHDLKRPSVSTPHVALAMAAAIANRRLDVVMLERHLGFVAGGATSTGAHAKRVKRMSDDLLFREPGVSERVDEA